MDVPGGTNKQHSVWSAWINKKFDEYREGRRGGNDTLTSFANLFGASHSVVIGWMRPGADPPRKAEYIARLVERYGVEAYVAIGIPLPAGVDLSTPLTGFDLRLLDAFREVPDEFKDDAIRLLEHYLLSHGWRQVK